MKHKLIAGILTGAIVSGAVVTLPFKEVNIQPQLDKIYEAKVVVNKASTVITKLVNNNSKLAKENDELQKEINNGNENSNINYKDTPSMNEMLGSATSKEFKKTINYIGNEGQMREIATKYYQLECNQQFINYYKYLFTNGIYYNSDKVIYNSAFEQNKIASLTNTTYGTSGYSYLSQINFNLNMLKLGYNNAVSKDPENVNNMTIPVNDQINMQDIKLPANLQTKLNKCFDLYTNYCKNNNLNVSSPSIDGVLIPWYYRTLMNEYLVEYYTYICAHPEVLGSRYTNANPKAQKTILTPYQSSLDTYTKRYSTACEEFNKNMDSFITKLEKN